MKCPHCSQEIEAGAVFCGNCGQPLQAAAPATPAQPAVAAPEATPAASAAPAPAPVAVAPTPPAPVATVAAPAATAAVPAYSIPVSKPGGGKAIASMVLGIIGLIAWIIPGIGFILSITGFVLGTLSLKSSRRGFAIAGIVLTIITMVLSLIAFVYNIQQINKEEAEGRRFSNSVQLMQQTSDDILGGITSGMSN